jgi:2-methylcitrate dehydratase PrpD
MSDQRKWSRRSMLQAAGWMVAGTALPLPAAAKLQSAPAPQGQEVSPAMLRLSVYMSQAKSQELPADALEKTKQHTLDTLASMISGSQLKPGQFAIHWARGQRIDAVSTPGVATVAACNVLCRPIEAAFANAMLAQADETDDSHSPSQSHPGCSIVPAALAGGERFAISGAQMLRAVALGYDIGTRITMTIGRGAFQTENHLDTHSVAGCFGSAAAAACAAGLNEQQMRWVLDYASQEASGIKVWQRDTEHMEKAFLFGGMPARAGIAAALLVQDGATGVNDVFSGADNFFSVFGGPQTDPTQLLEKLGERYEVTRTNIKKWTVGSPIQAPLDALENLHKRQPFAPADVREVVVRVAPSEGALVDNREMPDICLQHMVAVALIDGSASFRSAHDKPRMQDAVVLSLRAKVKLVPDPELEKLLPARVAVVEVTLMDGRILTERITAVRGTAENPMTREEVIAKSRDLMAPVLGGAQSSQLIDKVLNLEGVGDVRELRTLLQIA